MLYNLLCLTENTDLLDITESNKGKDNPERVLELAHAIKQTRIDRMANTASYMTFLQLF